MSEVARLSVPLLAVDRDPKGVQLGSSDGHVNGWHFNVTLTASELHFAFVDTDGPRFSVDLNRLAKDAVNEIEVVIKGKRRGGI